MLGVLGLLTGWLLLMPAALLLYMTLGGPYQDWMGFFLGIAASLPMLVFLTLAGLFVLLLSARQLARQRDM